MPHLKKLFFISCLRKLIVVVVFIHCMNQFVHICKCVCMLYVVTFYTKASYINKNVYYTCTVFAIKDPPFLGRCCYLKLKYHIIYNWTLKICSWLWQPSIINIFKVSFVIRAYHIYAINSEIFCSQRRRKKWVLVQEQCPEQNFTLYHRVYKLLFKKKAIGLLDLFGNDLE